MSLAPTNLNGTVTFRFPGVLKQGQPYVLTRPFSDPGFSQDLAGYTVIAERDAGGDHFIRCLLSSVNPVLSQDNTLYLIHSIPQANQLNPALMFPCKFYIELPVISSVKLNVRNTGFGFHDAVHTGTGLQSDTFYLDLPNLNNKLKRMNYFRMDAEINLLGFGFLLKDWYCTFGIINHTEVRVAYPHDVVSIRDGNWLVAEQRPNPLSFSGIGVDATNWNSIGVSAAKEVKDGLRLGIRLKYIQGVANINTRRSKLVLNTNPSPISLEAEMIYRLNASFPLQLGYANNGLVNSVNFDDSFSNIPEDLRGIYPGNQTKS